jgi:hypothetical protein
MEELFITHLNINGSDVSYNVIFDNEMYSFSPSSGDHSYPAFSLKREHDEWHEQHVIPAEVKSQATEALEKYLLKQH